MIRSPSSARDQGDTLGGIIAKVSRPRELRGRCRVRGLSIWFNQEKSTSDLITTSPYPSAQPRVV